MNKINSSLYFKNKLHEIINKQKKDNINIYKTLNSIIFKKENVLYCFNNDYCKKLDIKDDSEIYSNEKFYIIIRNGSLLFIDEYFNTKCINISFKINNVLLKENYMVINNNLKSILINIYCMVYFIDCELYDLYDKILFYSDKKNYIITNLGLIDNKNISSEKIKKLVNILKKAEGLDMCLMFSHLHYFEKNIKND